MKNLILNADDFGMAEGVNEGIIRAHREGILTSTTLMANGAAYEDAVERAKANPELGVGCHLVLVGGRAVAPLKQVRSLVDAEGNLPSSLGRFVAGVSSGLIRAKAIEQEFRAQIEKIRYSGIQLTHLDTHKHTHAHPRVMEALARVGKECGINRIRKPVERLRDSWGTTHGAGGTGSGHTMELIAAAAARAVTPLFNAISRKYGLRSPDYFLGLAMTGQLGTLALRHMVDTLPEGSTEIMLHPGLCDENLMKSGSRLQMQREMELQALLDPSIRTIILERHIRLISYQELN